MGTERGEKGQVLECNKEKGADGLRSVGVSPGRLPAARSLVTAPSYATKCEFERRRASETSPTRPTPNRRIVESSGAAT